AWTAPREAHRACYTTPFLLEQPGKPAELIVASTPGMDAYDPETGRVIWHYSTQWADPKKNRRGTGAPGRTDRLLSFYGACAGRRLIGHGGEGGSGRYNIASKPGGTGELPQWAKAWDAAKQNPYVPSMLTKGEYLYWVHDDGRAVCAEVKTGRVLWEETIFG